MIELTDTHCHIHEAASELSAANPTQAPWLRSGNKPDPDKMIQDAEASGVIRLICVGTTVADSARAVDFVKNRQNCWASIGIHPHEAASLQDGDLKHFSGLISRPKLVAIGECGLDYYYEHSPKTDQEKVLRYQLELAVEHDLPLIFHIREAFNDFWPIFDEYKDLRGVVHSFSSDIRDLEQILARGLYVGLNGIMTFTKNPEQHLAAKAIPLHNLLLETDAPFLTPTPYRGTICEPKHVRVTAEFLAGLRDENMATIAQATTRNARDLFNLQ